jgi:hypothetical protein
MDRWEALTIHRLTARLEEHRGILSEKASGGDSHAAVVYGETFL